MTKIKDKVVIPRSTLSGADAYKAATLMKHYYLNINEVIKSLIRKEYEFLANTKEK